MINSNTIFAPKKLEDVLLENNIISQSQLNWAQLKRAQIDARLEDILLNEGLIDEKSLGIAYSLQYNFEFIENEIKLSKELLNKIPATFFDEYDFIPIEKNGNTLKIAISSPYMNDLFQELEQKTGYEIVPSIIEKSKLDKIINSLNKSDIASETHMSDGAVKLLNSILERAWKQYASDIHFEFSKDSLVLKFRIDGALYEIEKFDKQKANFLITRIKILSNMDITEHISPQEGQFTQNINGHSINMRSSVVPSYYGESIVIRILNRRNFDFNLLNIGFSDEQRKSYISALKSKKGLIIVSGPTGSGKTTTLYAGLLYLRENYPQKKIITIEDPVEFPLEGISQIPIDDTKNEGLTFSKGLKAILRQDPDIIMIGEIRDRESAMIAINAAITGHLVLASIHAGNVFEIINRLQYFDIPPILYLDAISLITSQVLYKELCDNCKILAGVIENKNFYKSGKCDKCKNFGFTGRNGLFEVLNINGKLKEMVLKGELSSIIKRRFEEDGFVSIEKQLKKMLLLGKVSISEYEELTGETIVF
jgi:type IV pilus assembly protein PilB